MAEKLTPRLQRLKNKYPKRFAEYMKKRGKPSSAVRARQTLDKTVKGTPAEKAAIAKGEKAAIKARKEGKSESAAKKLGKKIAINQMKTNRSKTKVEAAWAAASAIPVGGLIVRGVRAAKAAGEGIKKLTGATVKKKAAQKAADAAKKTAAAAQKKATKAKWTAKKGKQVYTPPSQAVAKKTAATVKGQVTKAKNLASKSRTASRTATKQQKAVTAANVAGRKPLSTADRLKIGATGGIAAINIARQKAKKPKKVAAKPLPAKPKPSPAPVTIGDEERVGSSSPGKTITSNPTGEGSSTGLDLETILERIEEMEYPTDPDDPGAFDIDDLKADLKELRGYKHGGKVKGYKKGGSIKRDEEEASKAQRGKEKTKSAKVNAEIAKIEAAKANWMEGLTPKARKAWKQIRERDPVATAETTKRHARNKAKLEEMAEKKKQDFLADAKKFNKTSYIQGRPRATVRNIKARDVDKERTARGVGAAKRGFGKAKYSDKLY